MHALRHTTALAGLLGALALATAGSAEANQYTVYSCHDPGGAAVGHYGWTQSHVGGTFIFTTDTCAASGEGALVSELPGRFGGYSNLEGGTWSFAAPAGTSIAHYALHITGSYAQPAEGGGAGNDDVQASDEVDPTYDWRSLGAGSLGAVPINREPPDIVTSLYFLASCDASSSCGTAGQSVARISVSSATLLLNDSSTPKVANVAGSLTSGKALSGSAEASYEASDGAPGIYGAHYVVDGQVQPSVLLDSGQATCKNLGQTENGTRAFDSPEPCAGALSTTTSLESAAWVDGEHHVQLIVEDASGNSVTAFNGMVSFHNAPTATSEPTVGPQPGSREQYSPESPSENELEGKAAAFTAPVGAGNVTTESRWQRCDGSGANCLAIGGASGPSYTLTAADVGHTLRYASTGTDKDGSTTVASPHTALITEREPPTHSGPGNESPFGPPGAGTSITSNTTNYGAGAGGPPGVFQFTGLTARWLTSRNGITRAYPKSALKLTGRLLSPSGQPLGGQTVDLMSGVLGGALVHVIGAAKTNPNGEWTLRAPKGASRLLRVAYGPQQANAAGTQLTRDIVERVRPTVAFSVRSYGAGVIAFRGRVGFASLRPSLLAVVQARKGRGWQDVGAPARVARGGLFAARYSAAGLVGQTYTFRLFVPATHLSVQASSRPITATVR